MWPMPKVRGLEDALQFKSVKYLSGLTQAAGFTWTHPLFCILHMANVAVLSWHPQILNTVHAFGWGSCLFQPFTAAKLERISDSETYRFIISHLLPFAGQFALLHKKKPQLLLSRLGYIRWTLVCWDEMWIEVGGWSESLLTSNASWKTHLDSSNTLIVKDRNGCLFLFWQILALDSLSNSFFVQRQPWQSHHRYSWNSLMKFHPENKSWHSCSCAECGFNLKTRVIAKQTPHICCRVDLFLVAGITFLTCHLWAGKFSIINHSRDTSIWGVSLIAKPQQNGSPLLRQYSSPSNYWSTLRHFVKIQTK